jgi:N-acetyl-alpha-D-glucosaminyl L-malate synthase BshA
MPKKKNSLNIGISCYPTYGGSGVLATELGLELARRGHSVHFITYAVPIRLNGSIPNVFFHKVEVPEYPLFEYPSYCLSLASKIAEVSLCQGLDLLHAHYAIPHAASALLARLILGRAEFKIITTLHGTDITLVGNQPALKMAVNFSMAKSEGLTAVSHFLKQKTLDEFGIKKEIRVIPNFVDIEKFSANYSSKLAHKLGLGKEKILCHISNFRPLKRINDVISVFNNVHKKIRSRLLLIGDGPEIKKAKKQAQELGIYKDILFLGKQNALAQFLSLAHLLLLPSETESFGLVALEALSCQVPVIATRVGGLPELIKDGETGYLFSVGDVEGMSKAALGLLQDDDKRKMLGKKGREIAQSHYAKDKIVSMYEDYYREVLAQ